MNVLLEICSQSFFQPCWHNKQKGRLCSLNPPRVPDALPTRDPLNGHLSNAHLALWNLLCFLLVLRLSHVTKTHAMPCFRNRWVLKEKKSTSIVIGEVQLGLLGYWQGGPELAERARVFCTSVRSSECPQKWIWKAACYKTDHVSLQEKLLSFSPDRKLTGVRSSNSWFGVYSRYSKTDQHWVVAIWILLV